MKKFALATSSALVALACSGTVVHAQTAALGVPADHADELAQGWSAKKQLLGRTVVNDKGDRVGTIDDLVVADKMMPVAIVGVGGLVGIKYHEVAIPVAQLSQKGATFVLPGATKDVIKALPVFHYSTAANNAKPQSQDVVR